MLALTRFEVEGHVSGMELGSELGVVLGIENGRISSWDGYFSHSDALEAAAEPA